VTNNYLKSIFSGSHIQSGNSHWNWIIRKTAAFLEDTCWKSRRRDNGSTWSGLCRLWWNVPVLYFWINGGL